jgi:hypothetical protein
MEAGDTLEYILICYRDKVRSDVDALGLGSVVPRPQRRIGLQDLPVQGLHSQPRRVDDVVVERLSERLAKFRGT